MPFPKSTADVDRSQQKGEGDVIVQDDSSWTDGITKEL